MHSAGTIGLGSGRGAAKRRNAVTDETANEAANTHSVRLLAWSFGFAFSAMVWIEIGKALAHFL